jgi:excisionase family DNA binding protein
MTQASDEFLTTRELADLLRIKERKVYELAAADEVPCLRVTGKLLFPREAIEAWLVHHTSGGDETTAGERAQVFAGSHDPLLDWALRESGAGLATYFDGSLDGIERFDNRQAIAAGMHVHDAVTGQWNVPLVTARFTHQPVVLIEFAWRERGLIVAPNQPDAPNDVAGLRGRRVVPRQAAAGSQGLLEHLLAEAGIGANEVEMTSPARTETEPGGIASISCRSSASASTCWSTGAPGSRRRCSALSLSAAQVRFTKRPSSFTATTSTAWDPCTSSAETRTPPA